MLHFTYSKHIVINLFITWGKAKEVASFDQIAKLIFTSTTTSSYIFALVFIPPSMLPIACRKEDKSQHYFLQLFSHDVHLQDP